MFESSITKLQSVGERTIAIEVETPSGFEAYPGQFVLIRATINDEEETGYYTISSPNVEKTFEMTIAVDPDGTLGPWLAERTLDEKIMIEGPYGDIQYMGENDVLVFAGGPGIGPAVGIAERAQDAGYDVTIVYGGSQPPHQHRLTRLEDNGAAVLLSDDLKTAVKSLDISATNTYVFGFQEFVEETKAALSATSIDLNTVEMESFGPA